MKINEEAFQIRNRKQQRIREQVNLGDGTSINPYGSY